MKALLLCVPFITAILTSVGCNFVKTPQENKAYTQTTEITAETTAENKNTTEVNTAMKMTIKAGNSTFTATLENNSSVEALKEMMKDKPLTLEMSDYANMEKGADLPKALPQNNVHMNTKPGDIILYQGRTLVIYYDTNSWSLTPIGKIENVDANSLKKALGTDNVTVTFSLDTK